MGKTTASRLLGLTVLVCSGCFSMSLLQEPKPLPVGKVRVAVAAEVGKHAVTPAVGLRLGVGGSTEVRLKASAGGGEGGINVQLFDGELLDVMVMPQAFYYDVDDFLDEEAGVTVVGAGVPTVVSVSFEEDEAPSQVFVAPDVRVGARERAGFAALGAHVGVAVSGPYGYGSFVPECAWLVGALGSKATREHTYDQRFLARGEHTFSCSFGVSLGGRHPRVGGEAAPASELD